MSLQLRIEEGRTAFLDLAIQGARLDQDVRKAVRELAGIYRQRVVAELRAPKSGKKYGARTGRAFYRRQRRTTEVFGGRTASYTALTRVTGRTRAYTASAPGQAPAVFTGTLVRSVKAKIPPKGKGWSARVFADRGTAFYRHMLEFGHGATRKGRKGRTGPAAPRPIWSKYQAQIERDLPQRIVAALERFQRGG
jgi:hypothetical protein